MASTNKTTHYELSQYVGSDKPTYLTDYNNDMSAIDTGIYNAQTKADSGYTLANTADGKADTALTNAGSAQTDASSALTKIGIMANLETTEKGTLVGAVNEIKEEADSFKPVMLWTNLYPVADFAGQTINLNLTDYEFIEVYYTRWAGDTELSIKFYFQNAETQFDLQYVDYDSGTVRSWNRSGVINTSYISFNDAKINGTTSNSALIPYKIIGYKD